MGMVRFFRARAVAPPVPVRYCRSGPAKCRARCAAKHPAKCRANRPVAAG